MLPSTLCRADTPNVSPSAAKESQGVVWPFARSVRPIRHIQQAQARLAHQLYQVVSHLIGPMFAATVDRGNAGSRALNNRTWH